MDEEKILSYISNYIKVYLYKKSISSDNLFLRDLLFYLKSWSSCLTNSLIPYYNDLAYFSNARPLSTEYRDTLLENVFKDNFRG